MKDIDKIVTLVKRKFESASALHERIESDYRIIRGEPFSASDGYHSYTDNTLQKQAFNAVNLMAKAKKRVFCPQDVDREDRREAKSEAERFNYGCLNEFDRILRRRGENLSLQGLLAWNIYVTGAILVIPIITRDKKENTKADIRVYNRRWCTYQMGQDGCRWFASIRKLRPSQIYAEYGVKDMLDKEDNEQIEVIDWWTEEDHAEIIDQRAHKKPTPHNIGFHPLIVIHSGFNPYFPSTSSYESYKDVGESGLFLGRNLHEPVCILKSAALTQAYRHRKPNWKVSSIDGQTTLEDDISEEGKNVHVGTQRQENISPLDLPELPKDFWMMTQGAASQLSASGLTTPFGDVDPNTVRSALQLNIHQHSAASDLNPFMLALEAAYEEIAYSLAEQFSSQSDANNIAYEPMELLYKDEKGMTGLKRFSPEEIYPFRFKCEIELDMPHDNMEKWMMARMAREMGANGTPLYPDLKIRDEILKVADADAYSDMILEEAVLANPIVRPLRVYNALKERWVQGDTTVLEQMKIAYMDYELAKQAQKMKFMQIMGGGPTPGQQGAMAQQPMQSPSQGMNIGSMVPQGGMQPGFTPEMGSPMSPMTEQNMRMAMAGLVPPR